MESVANSERSLEMLADYIDALNARSDEPQHVWRVGASLHPEDDNPIPLDPATLRAQAQALREYTQLRAQVRESGIWQGRMNMACLRLDRHAEGMAAIGNDSAARAYRKAADIVGEEYHAALCDLAGGEA